MVFSYYDNIDSMNLVTDESDEEELSMFKLATQSQADIYYKFRYTFPNEADTVNCQRSYIDMITTYLRKFMLYNKWTCGIEHFKSGMQDAKPHCHIHFISRAKKDTIVHSLKYACKDTDFFHGNRCYSLGVEVNVNEDKFFRYPFKQQKNETARFASAGGYFGKDDIIRFRSEAYAVWITACEIQNAKQQKKDESTELIDRLFDYLDKQGVQTELDIKVATLKFYVEEENKPINRTTVRGYCDNYRLKRKYCSYEEIAKSI